MAGTIFYYISGAISDAISDAISYMIPRLQCQSFFLDVEEKTSTSPYDKEDAPKRRSLDFTISSFDLRYRKVRYRYTILGGRSKTTLFGFHDIEVLTFDIEEKTSILLYCIGHNWRTLQKDLFGNFNFEVFFFDIIVKTAI